jgi:dihydroflavonol-4-reductase
MTRSSDGEKRPRCALVTGASGYVGANLVHELLARGWKVRTFSRRPPPTIREESVDHTTGDIRDAERLATAIDGVDVVFHLAAKITLFRRDPEAWSVNTIGPATVARVALEHRVARLVHCSSVHAFDLVSGGSRIDEHHPRPGTTRRLYDRSKAAGEAAVRAVAGDQLEVVIVNPTGIIGPTDFSGSRINAVLLSAARGHLPVAVGGGFDWVDVRDVVQGILAATNLGEPGENYLLSGHRAAVLDLARRAAILNGRTGPLVALPPSVAEALAPIGEQFGRLWHSDKFTPASIEALCQDPIVDCRKAQHALGYSPRPLDETLRDLIQSWRDQGKLKAQPGRRRAASNHATAD